MSNNLIRQLQANHELMVQKIAQLESTINSKCTTGAAAAANNKPCNIETIAQTNQKTTNEKQKLLLENENLRSEIRKIRQLLTELQMKTQGDDAVPSMNALNEIESLKTHQSSDQITPEKSIESIDKQPEPKDKQPKCQPKSAKKPSDKTSSESDKNKGKNKPESEPEKAIDASRLDLRVGRIIDVKKHPDADSLYVEQIDCGEDKPRTVVSGLVKFVPIEQMQDRMVVVLCNLKPAKMRGITSEAMVMCASTPDKVEILSPPDGCVPGDRVSFEKYPGQPDQQLNPKKKIWEQIAPDLRTNDNLEATYKGDRFIVEGRGPVTAQTLKNVSVK